MFLNSQKSQCLLQLHFDFWLTQSEFTTTPKGFWYFHHTRWIGLWPYGVCDGWYTIVCRKTFQVGAMWRIIFIIDVTDYVIVDIVSSYLDSGLLEPITLHWVLEIHVYDIVQLGNRKFDKFHESCPNEFLPILADRGKIQIPMDTLSTWLTIVKCEYSVTMKGLYQFNYFFDFFQSHISVLLLDGFLWFGLLVSRVCLPLSIAYYFHVRQHNYSEV